MSEAVYYTDYAIKEDIVLPSIKAVNDLKKGIVVPLTCTVSLSCSFNMAFPGVSQSGCEGRKRLWIYTDSVDNDRKIQIINRRIYSVFSTTKQQKCL